MVIADCELDLSSLPRLNGLLGRASALADETPVVAVDLSRAEFVDTEVLKTLARKRDELRERGGDLYLVAPLLARARRVFELTERDQPFRFLPDHASAPRQSREAFA